MKISLYCFKNLVVVAFILLSINSCKNSDCENNSQDGDETGIDCGGDCEPCATCTDGIKNQDEVAVDCGGSCSACSITYPDPGSYGPNLLAVQTDTLWTSGEFFSMKSVIPVGSSLRLELELVNGTSWFYGDNNGYAVGNYSQTSNTQSFTVLNSGVNDIEINLPFGSTFIIKYFENGSSETKRKVVVRN